MADRFFITAELRMAAPTNANIQSVIRQIENQFRGVNVNLNVNVNARQLNTVDSALKSVKKSADASTDSMEAFGRQSALAIRRYTAFAVATGTFLALGRAIQTAFSDAIDFDKQLTKLRQVTGLSQREILGFSDTISKLATGLGISSQKLSEVSLVLAQAGLTASQTTVALKTLAKTELSATFDDITDTTEGAIAILNQFEGGVNSLERDLSALNSVSAKFAVESSDLVVAVRRTGGAFQAAGGSLNELLALFTSVRQTTRESAETIATGFRTIFTRLQRTRTVNFLETLGIGLRNLEGEFVGPYEAVRRLSFALKDISSTDPRFAQIIEELGGFRQVSKVIPLIKQFAVSEKALSVALRSSNSLSQDAAVAQESLANKIVKVKEEFAALIRTLSQNTTIRDFIEISLKLASALVRVADSLQGVLPLLLSLGTIGAGKALSGFTKGFVSELGTTKKFARGGLVPGQGNGDTVPALLTPGEFVMRKSAVQAIGAGNLAKANGVQKFALGGRVLNSVYRSLGLNVNDSNFSEILEAINSKTNFQADDGEIAAFLNKKISGDGRSTPKVDLSKFSEDESVAGYYLKSDIEGNNSVVKNIAVKDLKAPYQELVSKLQEKGALAPDFAGYDVLLKNFTVGEPAKNRFLNNIGAPFESLIQSAAESLVPNSPAPLEITQSELNRILENINLPSVYGSIFEGALQAYSKNIRISGPSAILDFQDLQDYAPQFNALFSANGEDVTAGVRFGDAKLTRNNKSESSIIDKFAREKLNKLAVIHGLDPVVDDTVEFFNRGGGVPGKGTRDTVPALLTPGEFVINRESAQAIGYGNLAKANKVKKFNIGGRVPGGASGAALGIGGLGVALPVILSNFVNFGEEFGKVATTITSVVTNFAIFNELLKNVTGVKDFQNSITEIDTRLQGFKDSVNSLTDNINSNLKQIAANKAEQKKIFARAGRKAANLSPDELKRILDLQDQNKALDTENTSSSNSINKLGRKRSKFQSRKLAEQAELRNRKLINFGAAVGGTALTIGSQYFGERANANFTDGNFGAAKNFALASGTLSGAGSGAGIGAAIGNVLGPVGSAFGSIIGGAIGAVAGFATSLSEADAKISRLQFDKNFENFSQTLEAVNKDKLNAFAKAADVTKTLSLTRERLASVSGDDKETLTGQIDSQVVNLEGFLTKLAEGSKTFEDFQKAGNIAIGFLAQFTNQTVTEVNTKFKNLIEQQGKVLKLSKEQAEQESRNLQRLKDIGNLTSAFKDLNVEVNRQINAQKGYTDFLLNGKFSSASGVDESDIFDRIGSLTNPARFNQLATNIGNNAGATGSKLANELIQSSEAIKNLPSILVESTQNTLESDGGFEGNLKRALAGAPDFLIKGIEANLSKLRGPEGNDEKVIGDIFRDPTKVAEQLTENIQIISDVFKTAAPIIQSQIDAVANALSTGRELRQKLIEGEGKIDQIRNDSERIITEGLGKVFDPQNNINARRNDINRQVGLAGRVGLSANSIAEANARIKEIEGKQQVAALDQKRVNDLEILKSQEIQSIEAAKTALEKLADASGDLADLQNKLTKASEKRQLLTGAAETLTFGDPASIRQLTKNVVSATALANGNTSSAFRNQETLSFLKSVGDTKLGVLNGKSGNDVIKEQAANQLSSLGLTGDEISRVLEVTEDEKSIISQIRDRSAEAISAQQELNKLVSAGISINQDSINKMIAGFGDTLGKFLKQAEDARLERVKLDEDRVKAREASINKSRADLGGIDENQIRANISSFDRRKELIKERDSLRTAASFTDIYKKEFGSLEIVDDARLQPFLTKFFKENNLGAGREKQIQEALAKVRSAPKIGIGDRYEDGIYRAAYRNANLADDIFTNAFKEIIKTDEVDKNLKAINVELNNTFGAANASYIIDNLDKIKKALNELGVFRDTSTSSPAPGMARGGIVPGTGNKDSVPAVLMPGEAVIPTKMTKKYAPIINGMIDGTLPQFAKGRKPLKYDRPYSSTSKIPVPKTTPVDIEKDVLAQSAQIQASRARTANNKAALDGIVPPLKIREVPIRKGKGLTNVNPNAEAELAQEERYAADDERRRRAAASKTKVAAPVKSSSAPTVGTYNGFDRTSGQAKVGANALNSALGGPKATTQDLYGNLSYSELKQGKTAPQPAQSGSRPIYGEMYYGTVVKQKEADSARNIEQIQKGGLSDEASAKEMARLKALDPGSKTPRRSSYFGSAYTPPKQAGAPGQVTYLDPKVARKVREEEANAYTPEQDEWRRARLATEKKMGIKRSDPNSLYYNKEADKVKEMDGRLAARGSLSILGVQSSYAKEIEDRKSARASLDILGVKPDEPSVKPISKYQEGLNNNRAAYAAEMERRRSSPEARRRGVQPTESNKPLRFGDVFGGNQTTSSKPNQGESVNKFAQNSEALVTSLNNFPREITMNATHRIEVIFNGAEVLAQLQKPLQDMAIAKATEQLNKYIKTNTPEAPGITVMA